jgi:hypothetical protein
MTKVYTPYLFGVESRAVSCFFHHLNAVSVLSDDSAFVEFCNDILYGCVDMERLPSEVIPVLSLPVFTINTFHFFRECDIHT